MGHSKKTSKKLTAYELDISHYLPRPFGIFDKRIPPMYSKELLDLANDMAFKKMSAMPFEQKYPMSRIEKSVVVVTQIILYEVVPYHKSIVSEAQILTEKLDFIKARLAENDTHNLMNSVLIVKMMHKKRGLPEPDFLKNIDVFTKNSVDDLWNMQDHAFDQMEEQFNNLTF